MPISPLPGGPSPSDPENFDTEADALLNAIRNNFIPEANALQADVTQKLADANEAKEDAQQAVIDAGEQVDLAAYQVALAVQQVALAAQQVGYAQAQVTLAADHSDDANTQRQIAQAAAATALAAPGTQANSSSSVTIPGVGTVPSNVAFTIEPGKSIVPTMTLKAASVAAPDNWILGDVVSYNATTGALVMKSSWVQGAGTWSQWTLALSAPPLAPLPNPVVSRSAAFTLSRADHGAFQKCVGSFAITTPVQLSDLGTEFYTIIKNAGTGLITISDGTNTLQTIGAGRDVVLVSNGVTVDFYGMPTHPVAFNAVEVIFSSQTWNTKVAGLHRFTLQGPGGSGAAAKVYSTGKACATGGAAGGTARKTISAAVAQAFTLTIGAGGAAVSIAAGSTSSAVNGNAGGTTSLSGAGVTVTANGGAGGQANITGATIAGAIGGAATGGDSNTQGGNSGSCTNTTTTNGGAATGGGAPGLIGPGQSSGNATVSGDNAYAATGGAGLLQGSANATANSTTAASAGGASRTLPAGFVASPINLAGTDGTGSAGSVSGAPGTPGAFGAPGAHAASSGSNITPASAGLGAGSAGRTMLDASSAAAVTTAAGGAGFIIVEYAL
jgi:hypothetical protein